MEHNRKTEIGSIGSLYAGFLGALSFLSEVVAGLLNPKYAVENFKFGLWQWRNSRNWSASPLVEVVELGGPFEAGVSYQRGGLWREDSHSWGLVSQRFARDLMPTTSAVNRSRPAISSRWPEFGVPVLAPLDGVVVQVLTGVSDNLVVGVVNCWPFARSMLGNHVCIETKVGLLTLAHLQNGSVCVSVGDVVKRGHVVGGCGSSGRSSAPHLHLQLESGGTPGCGVGIPIVFEESSSAGDLAPNPKPSRTEIVRCFVGGLGPLLAATGFWGGLLWIGWTLARLLVG